MAPLHLHHTVGASDDLLTRLKGAAAFIFIWGGGEFVGPLSPFLFVLAALTMPTYATLVLAALLAYPFLVPESSLYSPAFCRFALGMAGWLKGGSTIWVTEPVHQYLEKSDKTGIMVCYHPHGLIPLGFSLNGAVRARSKLPGALPSWLAFPPTVSGVQAPVLFNVPILRWILLAFGCCVPATKSGMHRLMRARTTYGIIPGGSEEVALHRTGEENLYLKHRAGFIKYALQYGYTLLIAFSYGESDLYRSLSLLRPLNLWLVKRFGFVLPVFAGHWACPLLPRTDVPLNTVIGAALVLPQIDEPSKEDVDTWHARYVAELETLYDAHKEQFGYAQRKLKFY